MVLFLGEAFFCLALALLFDAAGSWLFAGPSGYPKPANPAFSPSPNRQKTYGKVTQVILAGEVGVCA